MTEIKRNRIRPSFYIIILCWLLFNDGTVKTESNPEAIFYGSMTVLVLLCFLIFQVREKISLTTEYLDIKLLKSSVKIKLSTIKEVSFGDCCNILYVSTSDTKLSFKSSQFNGQKVEKFFIENGLYVSEEEEINLKITRRSSWPLAKHGCCFCQFSYLQIFLCICQLLFNASVNWT